MDRSAYLGRVNCLNNVNEFKTIYQSERLSDEEIDSKASEYEDLYNSIVEADDYALFLKHLDEKDILKRIDSILELPDGLAYEKALFDLLKNGELNSTLQNLRISYFSNINSLI